MNDQELDIVTGAFSFSGRYIARRLIYSGRRVRSLNRQNGQDRIAGVRIETAPLDFSRPDDLVESMKGASTLYNTYWIRFSHSSQPEAFQTALRNSRILFECAQKAGISRIVHLSVTNATQNSTLSYFKGKAETEASLVETGISHAILRPSLVFAEEDILLNNIAWLLRHFPFFAIPGDGKYSVQPVYAGDLAEIAVNAGGHMHNQVEDVTGPDTFTFEELLRLVSTKVGSKTIFFHCDPQIALDLASIMGWFMKDVLLTKEELQALMENLLTSRETPIGHTKLTDWLDDNGKDYGMKYHSQMERHRILQSESGAGGG